MALDIQNLTLTELLQIVNSSRFGTVLNRARLRRQMDDAAYQIGDGRRINLVRYVGWLIEERHKPKTVKQSHEELRARDLAVKTAARRIYQDIGAKPPRPNYQRRKQGVESLRRFCEIYFKAAFSKPWSGDHLRVIGRLEQAICEGRLYALAMPRASGKTTLLRTAALWAVLTGRRRFVCIIGGSKKRALELLKPIKREIVGNADLLRDHWRAIYPLVRLGGEARKQLGQHFNGKPTYPVWAEDSIVFPTMENSKASGSIIAVTSLDANIRGHQHALADGTVLRPSFVILDDPQTRRSAKSVIQTKYRMDLIAGDVLGMAGPGEKIAAFMACTIICRDDLADQMLDRKKNPDWQGEVTKMVYSFPTNAKLWEEYGQRRGDELRADGDGSKATEFYRANREAMDAGSSVSWPARFNEDELSAIQHAMNLKFRNEAIFFAEYQNAPLLEDEMIAMDLKVSDITAKHNGIEKSHVPIECTQLTVFIDVQKKLQYWLVCAWADDFTGYVIDYGTYPDQRLARFTLRDARFTVGMRHKGMGLEAQIYASLEMIAGNLLAREWQREDGAVMRVGRCIIDANWGQSTDTVYQFCRRSEHAAVLMPSHGRFIGASSKPISEWARKPGVKMGRHWIIPVGSRRAVRHIIIDTNYWKSFLYARLAVAIGDPGCLSLFGRKSLAHVLLAEHITAEYSVATTGRGRTVDEWKIRPGRDNHWFDCLVGCAVAASTLGVKLPGMDAVGVRSGPRKAIRLSDLQAGGGGGEASSSTTRKAIRLSDLQREANE